MLAAAVALVAAVGLLSRAVISAERERTSVETERLALWRLDARATALVIAEAARSAAWDPQPGAVQPASVDEVDALKDQAFTADAEHSWPAAVGAAHHDDNERAELAAGVAVAEPVLGTSAEQPAREAKALDRADYASRSANVAAAQQRQFLPMPSAAKAEHPLTKERTTGAAAEKPAELAIAAASAPSVGADKQVAKAKATATPAPPAPVPHAASVQPQPGPVVACWQGESLVLSRQRGAVEEVLPIAWPALHSELLASISDLLPAARLVRTSGDGPLRLAALPVTLVPGSLPPIALSAATRWTLGGAWTIALAGLGGAIALVVAAAQLAQRRAAFVSAVTHELRTPLTALRLHSDLLADERVAADPQRRANRIGVIRGEAARLAHLIENVLDYARLERRRPPEPRTVALTELLNPLLPRLAERLNAVGLILEVAVLPPVAVRCDPAAVERILLNLADNAAKYAASASDRRIEFSVLIADHRVGLILRDHGPGLAADAQARLFVPFARSAEAAAGSAPGIGLGLALCRRLARAQGGDLRPHPVSHGCAMELCLPLAG